MWNHLWNPRSWPLNSVFTALKYIKLFQNERFQLFKSSSGSENDWIIKNICPSFSNRLVPHPFTSTHLPHSPCTSPIHLNPPSPLPLYLSYSSQSTFTTPPTPLVSHPFTSIHLLHSPCIPDIHHNPPSPHPLYSDHSPESTFPFVLAPAIFFFPILCQPVT